MASGNSKNIIKGEKAFKVRNFEDLRQETCGVHGALMHIRTFYLGTLLVLEGSQNKPYARAHKAAKILGVFHSISISLHHFNRVVLFCRRLKKAHNISGTFRHLSDPKPVDILR
jgi:hypothetical protein